MSKLRIIIGDWGGDGHEKTDVFVYDVNKKQEEIQEAYKITEKETGVSLTSDTAEYPLFRDYEDNNLFPETRDILVAAGIPLDFFEKTDTVWSDNNRLDFICEFHPGAAAELYLEMAKINLPDLEWKLINDDFIPTIKGIGYGLYY